MDKKIEEILKQINRRLMNTESSMRLVEQRIDVFEGTIKAIERKVGRNTQDITGLTGSREEIERLKDAVIKLQAELDGLASSSDVDALRKYLELASINEKA